VLTERGGRTGNAVGHLKDDYRIVIDDDVLVVGGSLGWAKDQGMSPARLVLAAAVLNMVLPSKMGDLAKAYFIRDRDEQKTAVAVPLVIFEKTCDVLALLAWCGIGLLALPKDDWRLWLLSGVAMAMVVAGALVLGSKTLAVLLFRGASRLVPIDAIRNAVSKVEAAWEQMHAYFWGRGGRLAAVVALSLAVWCLHLLQIWMFIVALRGSVPFAHSMGLTALAIFAGLALPAYAGIGTRDVALIYFYRSYLSPETAAAVGILCTTRYVMPALAGLPFLNRYLRGIEG